MQYFWFSSQTKGKLFVKIHAYAQGVIIYTELLGNLQK